MTSTHSVMVTGASGMIGRAAVDALVQLGWTVHATSRNPHLPAQSLIRWHAVDLLDHAAVAELMANVRCEYLLHLAWITEPPAYWTSPLNVEWVTSSVEMLKSFSASGGQRAVFAGTCAEYDWSESPLVEGVTPLRPATPYGRSKLALSLLAEDLAAARGISFAWGRVFFAFGPYEHPARLVAAVTRSLLAGRPIACSTCDQVRDLLYAGDVGSALVRVLDSSVQGAVNVCSGQGVRLAEVITEIGEQVGRRDLIRFGELEDREHEPKQLVGDAKRLRGIGWCPAWTLRDAIGETVRWWCAQPPSALA